MNSTAQNPLNRTVFEVPDPTEEFGQDGGKFYRCYDALADEIDEDTVKGLKEQLDGMLIFAGLFASVNSAFLALTLPLLSADPADDTNALLTQNNAILIQLATGRNDSIPTNSTLPSTEFSPSGNIFAINALFSLSLAFAIISSFLAVLGRQWLIYYRKRSGGGPDRQRWEQLKRYLGAERWRLEPLLDDVLPSLLQIGLIIFCISLVLYLHHLSPAISILVATPLYIGLAFFIGSALCTRWDEFCPFHSPLSHMLVWSARKIPLATSAVKGLKWNQIGSFSLRPLLNVLIHGRVEESRESLQVIALQRSICTSDDPVTLLSATANIFAITTVAHMEQLWSSVDFRERFCVQLENSYSRGLQIRGRDAVDFAGAVQRLYCAAATHCILLLDTPWADFYGFRSAVRGVQAESVFIPGSQISNSPICLIRSTLAFSILHFSAYPPSSETVHSLLNYVVMCCKGQKHQDWKFFRVLSSIVSNIPRLNASRPTAIDSFRKAYRGDEEHAVMTLTEAINNAAPLRYNPEGSPSDPILITMLQCVHQMIIGDQYHIERKFRMLTTCESYLRHPGIPEEGRQIIRKMRVDLAQVWERECEVWAAKNDIPTGLFDLLDYYTAYTRGLYKTSHVVDLEGGESVAVLRVFGPPTCKVFAYGAQRWRERGVMREKRKAFRKMFDEFVMDLDAPSRQNQKHARRVQDPDERWCHWQEESASISKTICSLPQDPPYAVWKDNAWDESWHQ